MKKLTKEEVFETIDLIDYGDYENSLLDFFEELNDLTLNVTQEEKETIIKFIKQEISFSKYQQLLSTHQLNLAN